MGVFIRGVGFSFWVGCCGNVRICGCVLGVGEGGSFDSDVSCAVCMLGVTVGKDPGRDHPLHWFDV